MKFQSVFPKEIRHILCGCVILDGILLCAAAVLFGGFPPPSVLLAALGGTLIALLNFTLLCITVHQAVQLEDAEKIRAKFRLSYHLRMVIQTAWAAFSCFSPCLSGLSGILPLFFPKITILFRNAAGRISR